MSRAIHSVRPDPKFCASLELATYIRHAGSFSENYERLLVPLDGDARYHHEHDTDAACV